MITYFKKQRLKKYIKINSFQKALLLLIGIFMVFPVQPLMATTSDLNLNYTENNIDTFDPTQSAGSCSASQSSASSLADFAPDPKAVTIFESDIKPNLSRLAADYQQAAREKNIVDWQILAGLHYEEANMSFTNPTSNLDYKGVFQMNGGSLQRNGIDPNAPIFAPGHILSDSELTEQAKDAIATFLLGDAKAPTVNADLTKPLNYDGALNLTIAYGAGPASSWFNDPVNKNLFAYSLAGYDVTQAHALPMKWGQGSPNPAGPHPGPNTRPGAVTVWALVRSNGGVSTNCGNGITTVNNVVFYSQYDPRWANVFVFSIDATIAQAGCYLTANAMIVSTLTGRKVLPSRDTELGPSDLAARYGLIVDSIFSDADNPANKASQADIDKMKADIANHYLVIIHGMNEDGLFWGSATHWVVVRGINSDGTMLVNDPADFNKADPALPPPGGHTYQNWNINQYVKYAIFAYKQKGP